MERQFKKKLASDKKIADKQRRDSERQLKMNARRERATSIVMGQPTVGDIRILDSSAEELVKYHQMLLGVMKDNPVIANYIKTNAFKKKE